MDDDAQIHAAFSFLTDVPMCAGRGDGVVAASDAFLALVGRTRAELEAGSIDWVALTPEEWRSVDADALAGLHTDGRATAFAKEYLHSSGRRVPVVVNASRLSSEPFEWVAVVLPRPEPTDTDIGLRTSQAMLEALVEGASIGIAFLDTAGHVLRANATLATLLGRDGSEVVGRRAAEALGPSIGRHADDLIHEMLTHGTVPGPVIVEQTLERATGLADLVITVYPVRRGPQPVGVGVVVTDVTAERRSRDRLRQLIDGLASFVGLLTPDGTLIEANRAALEAADLAATDVLGRPFHEAYWWAHDVAVQEQLQDAIRRAADGEIVRYDVDVQVAEGQLITIDFSLSPVVEGGQVLALVPSAIDVTDRRREARLVEATAELAHRLTGAETVAEVVAAICEHGAAALDASLLTVRLADADTTPLAVDATASAAFAAPTAGIDVDLVDLAIEHGKPTYAEPAHPADLVGDTTATGRGAAAGPMAALPLREAHGQIIGALGAAWHDRRALDEATRSRLATVSEMCSNALQRARSGDLRRCALEQLQQELLPTISSDPVLEAATLYYPATSEIGFGGDWYDLIEIDPGRRVAIVGDVVGHGTEAAARMTQVRAALAALLEPLTTLDELAEQASRVLEHLTGALGYVATACICTIDLDHDQLRVVNAGHPPPVLVAPDGTTTLLDGCTQPPLGLVGVRRDPPQAVPFPHGTTLVAYTDGLVERKGRSIADGIDRLSGLVARVADEPLASTLDTAAAVMLADEGARRDDIAVLGLRRRAPEASEQRG